MSDRLRLRRQVFEELGRIRWGRRALKRQIWMLSRPIGGDLDDWPSGVREPRRPIPPADSGRRGR